MEMIEQAGDPAYALYVAAQIAKALAENVDAAQLAAIDAKLLLEHYRLQIIRKENDPYSVKFRFLPATPGAKPAVFGGRLAGAAAPLPAAVTTRAEARAITRITVEPSDPADPISIPRRIVLVSEANPANLTLDPETNIAAIIAQGGTLRYEVEYGGAINQVEVTLGENQIVTSINTTAAGSAASLIDPWLEPRIGHLWSTNALRFREIKTALVVDDEDDLANLVIAVLKSQGITVERAVNGREALDRLADTGKARIDFVYSDVKMPVMDGPTFVRQAKGLYGDDIVVAMASGGMEPSQQQAVQQFLQSTQIIDFIDKPFTPARLIASVNLARRSEARKLLLREADVVRRAPLVAALADQRVSAGVPPLYRPDILTDLVLRGLRRTGEEALRHPPLIAIAKFVANQPPEDAARRSAFPGIRPPAYSGVAAAVSKFVPPLPPAITRRLGVNVPDTRRGNVGVGTST
jgi:CheY-like chemotaxis protein